MELTPPTQQAQLIEIPDEIQLNEQDEMQQVIGEAPGWMLRWGITLVFVAVSMLLLIGWLVKYPDTIPAPVVLLTENPPVRVVANSSGQLDRLLVTDAEEVETGSLLAVLENTADYQDVLQLERAVNSWLEIEEPDEARRISLPRRLELGELQSGFSAFRQNWKDFVYYIKNNQTRSKVRSLFSQIKSIERLNENNQRQEEILQEEVRLAKIDWQRNRELYNQDAVSKVALERTHEKYLTYQRQLETLRAQVFNNEINIQQLKGQIIALREQDDNSENQRWLNFREDLNRLASQISAYKQQYLISAPIAGRVSMPNVLSEQQFVPAGAEVFTIVPPGGNDKVMARVEIPLSGSGKVGVGYRANVRLDGFPFQEYGSINGNIASISPVPENEVYIGQIEFPDSLIIANAGLLTTYRDTIPFQQEMRGVANLISEDRRILERIFEKVLSAFRNS